MRARNRSTPHRSRRCLGFAKLRSSRPGSIQCPVGELGLTTTRSTPLDAARTPPGPRRQAEDNAVVADREQRGEHRQQRVPGLGSHHRVTRRCKGAKTAVEDLVGAVGDEHLLRHRRRASRRARSAAALRPGSDTAPGPAAAAATASRHGRRRRQRRLVAVELQPAAVIRRLLAGRVSEIRAERRAQELRHGASGGRRLRSAWRCERIGG